MRWLWWWGVVGFLGGCALGDETIYLAPMHASPDVGDTDSLLIPWLPPGPEEVVLPGSLRAVFPALQTRYQVRRFQQGEEVREEHLAWARALFLDPSASGFAALSVGRVQIDEFEVPDEGFVNFPSYRLQGRLGSPFAASFPWLNLWRISGNPQRGIGVAELRGPRAPERVPRLSARVLDVGKVLTSSRDFTLSWESIPGGEKDTLLVEFRFLDRARGLDWLRCLLVIHQDDGLFRIPALYLRRIAERLRQVVGEQGLSLIPMSIRLVRLRQAVGAIPGYGTVLIVSAAEYTVEDLWFRIEAGP